MASFTATTYGATQERDPQDYEKMKARAESTARAAYKKYGSSGMVQDTSAPLSYDADTAYTKAETERRLKAADRKADLAKTVDTRQASISDRVREALFNRNQLATQTAEKMRQLDLDADLKTKEQTQEYQTQLSKIDMEAYKNAADRIDSMSRMYDKGMLEYELAGLAQQNQLSLSDIERYFSLLKNDIMNQMQDMQMNNKLELEAFKQNWEIKSQMVASIISGLTEVSSAAATKGK